jgi:class 3 adenylate cyclase/tetratricopeptide (TPR) repeat protein
MTLCPSCATENPEGFNFCGACGVRLEAVTAREERKVITALFCDLVGSTALGERMDHEDVARLLSDYQATCRARIESHGGVVEKFIGDAVVGVFGVPAVHEDDPERAVRAALRIVDDLESSGLAIEVRIGVNTGEALVRLDVDPRSGEGFATGDTMNTAARLEAGAPVMGVAVGEATHRASAHAILFEELEPISAKGKAEPMRAWRAVRPIARVGTPERDRTPFVGRDLELQMLTQLFERSRRRPSTEIVTIVADPGLGKSRLIRELGRHVDSLPEFVVWREGRCLPYGDGVSFWALGEIVKAQAGILETDDQATIAAKLEAAITEPDAQTRGWLVDRLAPLVGLETGTAPPERTEAFTAWRRFLEQIAATGPAVLVVEDLHWADEGFVAFLEHLAERMAGLPMLIAVTARPELEERHPSWPPGRRSTVLSLSPLEPTDLETLVAATLPDASDELTRIVLERSGGSPLYAEQLAAMLHERALPIAGGALDEALIPQSVQALISARIDALPTKAKRVLMEASVVGKTFWSGAVAALGEHDDLRGSLAELVRREFARPVHPSTMAGEDEFGFWHALVRDVAYAELTKAERARMHGATARWVVERRGEALADAEIVLHHVEAALDLAPSAPDLETEPLTDLLADALVAAGESALRTDVPRAIPFLERALAQMVDGDHRELRAKLSLARARTATGDARAARPLFEDLLESYLARGDTLSAVRVADGLESALFILGETEQAWGVFADLRGRLGSDPSPALAELMALEAGSLPAEAALDHTQASIDMAGALGLPPPLNALMYRGTARIELGDHGGDSELRRAVQLLLEDGQTDGAFFAMYNGAIALYGWRPAEVIDRVDEMIELATKLGAQAHLWESRALRLRYLSLAGRFDEVEDEADPVLTWARRSSNAWVCTEILRGLSVVDRHRGGCRVPLDEFERVCRGTHGPSSLFAVAELAHTRGEDDTARALLIEAAEAASEDEPSAVPTAIELGMTELAEGLVARGSPNSARNAAQRMVAEAALAASEGRTAAAVEGYAAAADRFHELGVRPQEALALKALGTCLLAFGDTEGGVARLVASRELWVAMKAPPRIAEIDDLLAEL